MGWWNNIEFQNPLFLLLLLVIPWMIWWKYYRHKIKSAKMVFPHVSELAQSQNWKSYLYRFLPILRYLGLAGLIIALARPQLVLKEEEVTAEGIDIMMIMDLSSSMLARDFKPDRLSVSKDVAATFVDKRTYDRIGLVVFAGESFTQSPLTTDHRIVKDFLGGLTAGMLEDGTAIGMGLASAVNRLKDSEAKSKVVILLTDGVNNSGYIKPMTAAEIAKELDVKVYTIGVGSMGSAISPVSRRNNGQYVFGMARVEIDEELLREIARLTGGNYYRATTEESLQQIYGEIDRLEKTAMGRRKKKSVENVRMSGIADKGKAVGRDEEGKVYFIDGAVPGDLINAFIYKNRKGVGQGVIQDLIEPSPDRTDPFCQHFSLCGGCKWQHLSYERQIQEKQKVVYDAFDRIAKVEVGERLPILGADPTSFYRNKMEYTFCTRRWVPQEELDLKEEVSFGPAVGFHRAGSFDKVVEIEKCHLQDDYGNKIRNFVRDFANKNDWTYYDIREHHGMIRNMVMRNNRAGEWMVNVIFGENAPEDIESLLNAMVAEFDQIKSLWYTINTKLNDIITDLEIIHFNGEDHIQEQLGNAKFRIGPKSFFQTNPYQAEHLYSTVVEFCGFNGDENVYDLYTGLGSIALYLADHCKHVVGIEEIPEAIADAEKNKLLNNNSNTTFYAGDVKDILTTAFAERHGKPDIVITDPPRAGMHEDVVKMLIELSAPKLIYVSCNPSTQARDVKLLDEYYELVKIKPVDMFPHTHHIENVALLKLRDEKS